MRQHILAEIRRLAEQAGGTPPGKMAFARATGITEGRWSGVLWARWSEAVAEAGYTPNVKQDPYATDEVTVLVAQMCLKLGHVPTRSELKMAHRENPNFPTHGVFSRLFPKNADLHAALLDLSAKEKFEGLAAIVPLSSAPSQASQPTREGMVYLLKSGPHYKIGRSDNLERRVKEISVALPSKLEPVHFIRTDDPVGIEAYWHRRFADRRANGEWFDLSPEDVKAFRRRTFQ